jgi:hypothetical protein
MMKNRILLALSICIALLCGIATHAQGPLATTHFRQNKNLAAAQSYVALAYLKIDKAETERGDRIRGHAQQAKALLMEPD